MQRYRVNQPKGYMMLVWPLTLAHLNHVNNRNGISKPIGGIPNTRILDYIWPIIMTQKRPKKAHDFIENHCDALRTSYQHTSY